MLLVVIVTATALSFAFPLILCNFSLGTESQYIFTQSVQKILLNMDGSIRQINIISITNMSFWTNKYDTMDSHSFFSPLIDNCAIAQYRRHTS